MGLPTLVGSVLAILAVVFVVRALGLGGTEIANAEEASRIASDALPGFRPAQAFVSDDGGAALVCGETGDYALVKRHGAQFAVRRLARPLRVERDGKDCWIDSGERSFGRVRLALSQQGADKLLTMM